MASERLAELFRLLKERPTRRGFGQTLAGAAFAGAFRQLNTLEADAKKRKKKKKCKGGKQKCGKTCCVPGTCFDGACCPAARSCGTVCCDADQVCADPDAAICVTGQGTCETGANSCGAAGNLSLCNGTNQCFCVQDTSGNTRCAIPIEGISVADCGDCTNDSDCELLFPDVVGVFCGKDASGTNCGCPAGQNICGAPCPV